MTCVHTAMKRYFVVAGLLTILLVCGFALALLPSSSLEVQIGSVEPSGIFDQSGRELWLVNLTLSNRFGGPVVFSNRWIQAEARVNGSWTESGDKFAADSSGLLLLVPSGADKCRFHLTYSLLSLKARVGNIIAPLLATSKKPAFYKWYWNLSPSRPYPNKQGRWRTSLVEITLPSQSRDLPKTASSAHQP